MKKIIIILITIFLVFVSISSISSQEGRNSDLYYISGYNWYIKYNSFFDEYSFMPYIRDINQNLDFYNSEIIINFNAFPDPIGEIIFFDMLFTSNNGESIGFPWTLYENEKKINILIYHSLSSERGFINVVFDYNLDKDNGKLILETDKIYDISFSSEIGKIHQEEIFLQSRLFLEMELQ